MVFDKAQRLLLAVEGTIHPKFGGLTIVLIRNDNNYGIKIANIRTIEDNEKIKDIMSRYSEIGLFQDRDSELIYF